MPPPVRIPTLPHRLVQCGSCIVIHEASKDLIEWAKENRCDSLATVEVDEDKLFVELAIDTWEDTSVHFHIERARIDLADKRTEGCDIADIVKKISGFAEKVGSKPVCIRSSGKLTVSPADLPETGLILKLLGSSGTACGYPVSLTGGTLEVEGDLFTRITFRRDEENDGIKIAINFETEDQFQTEFLAKADNVVTIGADCFVFERTTYEVSNAAD